jgi:fluoride ion exporter CrcB/FEX
VWDSSTLHPERVGSGLAREGLAYDLLLINITGAFLLAFVTTLADATFLMGPTRACS